MMSALRRALLVVTGLGVTALALFPLQRFGKITPNTLIVRELKNFGHVILFVVVGLGLYIVARAVLGDRPEGRARPYVVALLAAALLAVGSETAQFFIPRDADVLDLARNLIGCYAALAVLASFDRRLAEEQFWRGARTRWSARGSAALLLLLTTLPVLWSLEAYRRRAAQFPQVLGFASSLDLAFVDPHGAELDRDNHGLPHRPDADGNAYA